MHSSPDAVACAMRTKRNGLQGGRARSARYSGSSHASSFPSMGEGQDWGMQVTDVADIPLTLALSHEGRGNLLPHGQ